MRLFFVSSTVAFLCMSNTAIAQTTLTVHNGSVTCSDLTSVVEHGRPAIVDRIVARVPPRSAWSDNRLVIDASAPAGLIVGECRRIPPGRPIGEAVRLSVDRHSHDL